MNHWKVLTVKPEFLSAILCREKTWEIRKTNTLHRGMVAFAGSKTFKIWGTAQLIHSTWMTTDQLMAPHAMQSHGLSTEQLEHYGAQHGAWAWKFQGAELLQEAIAWKPLRGCIVWSCAQSNLIEAVRFAEKRANPDRNALYANMQRAITALQKNKKGKGRKQRAPKKRPAQRAR